MNQMTIGGTMFIFGMGIAMVGFTVFAAGVHDELITKLKIQKNQTVTVGTLGYGFTNQHGEPIKDKILMLHEERLTP